MFMRLEFWFQNTLSAGVLDRGAKVSPEFGGSEKRMESEIENLLLQAPLDLKSYLRRC